MAISASLINPNKPFNSSSPGVYFGPCERSDCVRGKKHKNTDNASRRRLFWWWTRACPMLLFGKDGGRSERRDIGGEMEQKQSAEGLGPSRCSFYCYCISWAAQAAKRGENWAGAADRHVFAIKNASWPQMKNSFYSSLTSASKFYCLRIWFSTQMSDDKTVTGSSRAEWYFEWRFLSFSQYHVPGQSVSVLKTCTCLMQCEQHRSDIMKWVQLHFHADKLSSWKWVGPSCVLL